jgi:hypothetical protein
MQSLKRLLAAAMIRRSLKERGLSTYELESRHSDPANHLFNDSSYFLGRGEDSSCLLVRMAFRTNRVPECWLTVSLAGTGTYTVEGLPGEPGEKFSLGALKFICKQPGKHWSIRYSGNLKQEGKEHNVDLELEFEGMKPVVNFKHISQPADIAPVIAREKWTRSFLDSLKEIKKMHLEQAGNMTGTITVDGKIHEVNWRSVRDHSWGTRVWETWERHIWLSGVLDNGEAFNLSMIAYTFLGQLSAGYMTRGEQTEYLSALPYMDTFASDPLIPQKFHLVFYSRDGRQHTLEIEIPRFFGFMMDGVYYIHEGLGNFILDDIPGVGVAEFGLNRNLYDITVI